MTRLSLAQARRIALARAGFRRSAAHGARSTVGTCASVLDRIGLIQIDSVNVLVRSQELPLFARLGAAPAHAHRRRNRAPASCSSTGCTRRHPRAQQSTTTSTVGAWLASTSGRRYFDLQASGGPTFIDEVLPARRRRRPPRRPATSSRARRQEGAPGGTGTTARSLSSTCSGAGRSAPAGARTTSPDCTTSPNA